MAAKKSPTRVFHHKRKRREIGHIIEPLFCQQTKCYLVTNQVKNQVCQRRSRILYPHEALQNFKFSRAFKINIFWKREYCEVVAGTWQFYSIDWSASKFMVIKITLWQFKLKPLLVHLSHSRFCINFMALFTKLTSFQETQKTINTSSQEGAIISVVLFSFLSVGI